MSRAPFAHAREAKKLDPKAKSSKNDVGIYLVHDGAGELIGVGSYIDRSPRGAWVQAFYTLHHRHKPGEKLPVHA